MNKVEHYAFDGAEIKETSKKSTHTVVLSANFGNFETVKSSLETALTANWKMRILMMTLNTELNIACIKFPPQQEHPTGFPYTVSIGKTIADVRGELLKALKSSSNEQ